MNIRLVKQEDFSAIYELVKEAFLTAEVSDGTEQDFVNSLRSSADYLSELEFVAEDKNRLIGHIMFTRLFINGASADKLSLLLAPLCVRQEYRNTGIGSALIRHGHSAALAAGYDSACLVGNPQFYSRFGFKPLQEYGIANASSVPDQYVLACEFKPGSLQNIGGHLKII